MICWKIFFFLAVTIPSSGTILVTTDESNNTRNKKITYMKKIRLCIRPSCALEKGTFVIVNCSSGKKVHWRNDKTLKLLDLQIRTRTNSLKSVNDFDCSITAESNFKFKRKRKRKRKRKEKKRKGKKKENSETYPILWIFSVGVQAELWTDARPGLIMPFFWKDRNEEKMFSLFIQIFGIVS